MQDTPLTQPLDAWLSGLLRQLSPEQMARVNRRVALEVRHAQSQRIAAQRNPDGSAFAPRKKPPGTSKNLRSKKGRIRAKAVNTSAKTSAMFRRIRTARFLKTRTNAAQLTVGYTGKASDIAFQHQHGLPTTTRTGRTIPLPRRILLGLSQADIQLLANAYLRHLAQGMQAG